MAIAAAVVSYLKLKILCWASTFPGVHMFYKDLRTHCKSEAESSKYWPSVLYRLSLQFWGGAHGALCAYKGSCAQHCKDFRLSSDHASTCHGCLCICQLHSAGVLESEGARAESYRKATV